MADSSVVDAAKVSSMPFKSLRGGRVPWKYENVKHVSDLMRAELPAAVFEILSSGGFKGGRILKLTTAAGTCNNKDLQNNRFFIKPVVQVFADRVPSGYFLADVFMELDRQLDGTMLQPAGDGLTKAAMAVREGGHLKKVCGHLRYLFRNTANGRSEAVDELKKYLTKKKPSTAAQALTDLELPTEEGNEEEQDETSDDAEITDETGGAVMSGLIDAESPEGAEAGQFDIAYKAVLAVHDETARRLEDELAALEGWFRVCCRRFRAK